MSFYGDYIPDPVELGEMRAERWEHELDCRNGECNCAWCGKRCKLVAMDTASADPWSPPVCHDCLNAEEERIRQGGGE